MEQSLLVRQTAAFVEQYNLVSTIKVKLEIAHGLIDSALNNVMSAEDLQVPVPQLAEISTEIQHSMAALDNIVLDCKRSRDQIMASLTSSMSQNLEPQDPPERERTPRRDP